MPQNDYQNLYLWLLSLLVGLGGIAFLGFLLYRKGVISRRMLRYVVYPFAILPFCVMVTRTIFSNLSLLFQVMIAIGVVILSSLHVYLVREPLVSLIFPRLRKDRKRTGEDERL